ncbi:MAG: septum formation initiator family protein [Bdellovibrionales bacterium]|nr:septum formation initiator family protein [Bdellovibrionales bacterium]
MKHLRPYGAVVLLLFVVVVAVASLFGGTGFSDVKLLSHSLEKQRVKSDELETRVKELRLLVNGLQSDDRVLERFARDELALAKEGELVFFFEDKQPSENNLPEGDEQRGAAQSRHE